MRKMLLSIAICSLAAMLAGCNNLVTVQNGFGAVAPGIILSRGTQGGAIEPNLEILKRPYVHLGRVTGDASQSNILFLFTSGDASIDAAERDALSKVKNADALINRNFNVKHSSFLCLFTVATLQVTGDAIKFTDKGN